MPARRINFYLNTSDRLRSLNQEAQRNAGLHRALLNIAPLELTQACRVKHLHDGTLTLVAENAAIAAKLRQLTTRLLTVLKKERSEITSIRIEVQVSEAAPATPGEREIKPLSVETIENLEKLANDLDDSPLKVALAAMAARQRNSR
jgi:hypothetical protein